MAGTESLGYGYLGYIEYKGLILRRLIQTQDDESLCPFSLARALNIKLVTPSELSTLPTRSLEYLLGPGYAEWSAVTLPVPGEGFVVILNPRHVRTRQRITLMEEISHVFLRHRPSRIIASNSQVVRFRTYSQGEETEAYRVASAALVPYEPLRRMVINKRNVDQIAGHFDVSLDLAKFRIKITRLWPSYTARHRS